MEALRSALEFIGVLTVICTPLAFFAHYSSEQERNESVCAAVLCVWMITAFVFGGAILWRLLQIAWAAFERVAQL
jgi:hypothetical protein